jgi:myo-inositol-1-phosphate synthase
MINNSNKHKNYFINIGIIGMGNCGSALVQGLQYYKYKNIEDNNERIPGLMNPIIGGYKISDIRVTSAFDVDSKKVGKDISDVIFSPPNNTKTFSEVPNLHAIVNKGPVLDGVSDRMRNVFDIDNNQKELSKDEIIDIIKDTQTEILINFAPVGSQMVTEFWADIALESKCSFINCIPQFISSNQEWVNKFKTANLPILGDDIKSQIGATELHRTIIQMIIDRGGIVDNTWQLNYGGNTDFLNMRDLQRLKSKKISKTEAIQSVLGDMRLDEENIHIGPSDFIPHLKDNKICDIRIDFRIFGDIPCELDCKLSVEDSPNSIGCVIDCIRLARIGLDRKIGGPILPACAYYMKHPPEQMRESDAKKQLQKFIKSE